MTEIFKLILWLALNWMVTNGLNWKRLKISDIFKSVIFVVFYESGDNIKCKKDRIYHNYSPTKVMGFSYGQRNIE